ncbi:cation:proton antiporter [Candidatus Undinarchaeota archaeon]
MLLIAAILAVLLIAKLFGELAHRLGQPSILGELFAGIFLGPLLLLFYDLSGIPAFAAIPNFIIGNNIFQVLSDLGIFFLMVLAGMEMSLDELMKVKYKAFSITFTGVSLSFILGYLLGLHYNLRPIENLFFATTFTITAVAVIVKMLLDMGKLRSKIGYTLVTAATLDDIVGMFLLTIVISLSGGAVGLYSISIIFVKVLIFFIVTLSVGRYLMFNLLKISRKMKSSEAVFTMAVMAGLLIGIAAELIGLHMIIGAFIAGLLIREATLHTRDGSLIAHRFSGIALGFLAPIFFVWVGLYVSLEAIFNYPIFTLSAIILACVGKIFGCSLGAMFAKFKLRDAITLGAGLNARGVIGLVVIEIGRQTGLVGPVVYSIVVTVAFVTTLISPIIFGKLMK